MGTLHLEVNGMHCGGCVKSVTAALQAVPGVRGVQVDLPGGYASIDGDFPQGGEALAQAVTAAGYPAQLTSATAPSSSTTQAKKSTGCCG